MEGMLSLYFLTAPMHPFALGAAAAWPEVCASFIRAQESAHDLARLVSCSFPSCLPMCCNRTLCTGSLSFVSFRNCRLSLSPFSFRLTSHESLPSCLLYLLQPASLKLLVFMFLFYFLVFVGVLNSIIAFSLSPKLLSIFLNPVYLHSGY